MGAPNTFTLFVIRRTPTSTIAHKQYASLDGMWTAHVKNAAHFLTPGLIANFMDATYWRRHTPRRSEAIPTFEVVRITYADDDEWTIVKEEAVIR